MSAPRKKHRVLNFFFVLFVVVVTLWLVISSAYLLLKSSAAKEGKLPEVFGYRIAAQTDDSMGEEIPEGSLILAVEDASPNEEDIIVFYVDGEPKPQVGRVDEILSFEEDPEFSVVGDNDPNNEYTVKLSAVYGKVMYTVPYIGYAIDFLHRFNGVLFAVLIPGGVLLLLLIIRMIVSVRASRKAEDFEDDEYEETVEPINAADLVYKSEELDGLWDGRSEAVSASDIVTDQDMVHKLSNLNNALAESAAVKKQQDELHREEAEKIVLETAAQRSAGTLPQKESPETDYDRLIADLGLETKDSSDLISMLRQYGVSDEESIESVRKAAPFVRPVMTENTVELDLDGRPTKKIRVVSDEYGKFLVVESDQVETKIRLPF